MFSLSTKVLEQVLDQSGLELGKPSLHSFWEVERGCYKIDHNRFAPALLIIKNVKTGKTFKAGEIDDGKLKESLGF